MSATGSTERDVLDVPDSEADPVGDNDNVGDAVAVSVGDEVAVPETLDVRLRLTVAEPDPVLEIDEVLDAEGVAERLPDDVCSRRGRCGLRCRCRHRR